MLRTLLLLVLLGASLLPAVSIDYAGNYGPTANFSPFSYQIFTGTSMTSDGDLLTMTTVYGQRGVWFGRNGSGDGTWSMGPNAQGSYVAIRSRLSVEAKQWSFYLGDGVRGAGIYFNPQLTDDDRLSYGTATSSPLIDLDLQAFNTFEVWLKGDNVSYAINGVTIYSGLAASSSEILVIGDGSGSDVSGIGSMQVDWVSIRTGIDYASAPAIPSSVPEPGSAALAGVALLAAATRFVTRA